MHVAHLMHRPRIQLTFAPPIPTAALPISRATTFTLTQQLQTAIEELRPDAGVKAVAA